MKSKEIQIVPLSNLLKKMNRDCLSPDAIKVFMKFMEYWFFEFDNYSINLFMEKHAELSKGKAKDVKQELFEKGYLKLVEREK